MARWMKICWRCTRPRSDVGSLSQPSSVMIWKWRARAYASPCSPFMVTQPRSYWCRPDLWSRTAYGKNIVTPPTASTTFWKLWKSTAMKWLMSTSKFCLIVLMRFCAPVPSGRL